MAQLLVGSFYLKPLGGNKSILKVHVVHLRNISHPIRKTEEISFHPTANLSILQHYLVDFGDVLPSRHCHLQEFPTFHVLDDDVTERFHFLAGIVGLLILC